MTVIIQLSDEQATALEAKAAAEGLSVDEWIQKLAETGKKPARETRTGADLIAALQASPCRDIDIEPERYRLPVRGVAL
ncbi:MAG TPA: hypothetical protein VFZ08_13270 [Terriglobia bacterium]|nr:hypothetical protein [Terriglobia bacterium]